MAEESLHSTLEESFHYHCSDGFLPFGKIEHVLKDAGVPNCARVSQKMIAALQEATRSLGVSSFKEFLGAFTHREQRVPPGLKKGLPEFDEQVLAGKGHLFALLADMRKLSCDLWMVPCGRSLLPQRHWINKVRDAGDELLASLEPLSALEARPALRRVPGWPSSRPEPLLVAVSSRDHPGRSGGAGEARESEAADLSYLHHSLAVFLDAALDLCRSRSPRNNREKHLIALPLLGTGSAGARVVTGQVVREILPQLKSFCSMYNMDVCLCSIESDVHQVIQAERYRWDSVTRGADWSSLPVAVRMQARRLAGKAARGQLSLFLGAGVSMAAGLPGWAALIKKLAAPLMSDTETEQLSKLSFLDQAKLLSIRLGGPEKLNLAIAECLKGSPVFSLAHALLAALPVREVVTTNYDTLFEEAAAVSGGCVPLPFSSLNNLSSRWILKMHGCVNHPESIVLSREDYITYESQRAALAGIVQSMLVTKEMLFVGFSLSDENFHKICSNVKRSLGDSHQGTLGTAVFLLKEPFVEELWSRDLQIVNMRDAAWPPRAQDWASGGRSMEIFLDYLVAETLRDRNDAFLAAKFSFTLGKEERALKEWILQCVHDAPEDAQRAPQFERFQQVLMSEFGGELLPAGRLSRKNKSSKNK